MFTVALGTMLKAHDKAVAARLSAAMQPAPHRFAAGVVHAALALQEMDLALDALVQTQLPPELRRMTVPRLRTFLAGQLCAEHALRQLGHEPTWLGRDGLGAPRWPDGIVGSIAHCDRIACAAVAHVATAVGIGLDSERRVSDEALRDIRRACCTSVENARLFGTEDDALIATLVFSAKEAYYKAISPNIGRVVDFTEVEVQRLDASLGQVDLCPVSARLRSETCGAGASFVVAEDFVHTFVLLPPHQ
jgi:enterobactin synthetase component D